MDLKSKFINFGIVTCVFTNLEHISDESKLLILASDPSLDVNQQKTLSKIDFTKINWDQFLKNAFRNNLTPLINQNLKFFQDQIPVKVAEKLKKQTQLLAARQLKQELVFKKINKVLSEEEIEFIILKGFPLAHQIYRQSNLRPMVDIDIMVPETKVEKAYNAFHEIGSKDYAIAEHQFVSNFQHHPFAFILDGVYVEVHKSIHAVHDPMQLPVSLLWENITKIEISGDEQNVFKPEVFLFHLCHHLVNHLHNNTIKLIWCRDIAELLKFYQNSINWTYFMQLYHLSNATEEILHPLTFAKEWLNADVPDWVLAEVKTSVPEIADNFIWFAEHERNANPQLHLITKFKQIKTLRKKIIYVFLRLFPSAAYLLAHYRKKKKISLIYLYPKHFWRLTSSGIRSLYHYKF